MASEQRLDWVKYCQGTSPPDAPSPQKVRKGSANGHFLTNAINPKNP